MEQAVGIELYPKLLSLAGTRCYQPLRKSIVAKCCQERSTALPPGRPPRELLVGAVGIEIEV
jgi:hypothetical protein